MVLIIYCFCFLKLLYFPFDKSTIEDLNQMRRDFKNIIKRKKRNINMIIIMCVCVLVE